MIIHLKASQDSQWLINRETEEGGPIKNALNSIMASYKSAGTTHKSQITDANSPLSSARPVQPHPALNLFMPNYVHIKSTLHLIFSLGVIAPKNKSQTTASSPLPEE